MMVQCGAMDNGKPRIDRFRTYLALIRNAVGSRLFRNVYATWPDGRHEDLLRDGELSCAVFVSSILTLAGKLSRPHATVASTVKAMKAAGWVTVPVVERQEGDVLVWEAVIYANGEAHQHIGFSLGNGRVVSTSMNEKAPIEHDETFDERRKIVEVLRCADWDTEEG